jgi:arylsulfatase A-like enzyme
MPMSAAPAPARRSGRPNVVLFMADDLGRGMLSCYGQKHFETPNIDRIANEGMRFTRAYGCALCAPARASLMLGRHDCHSGYWTFNTSGVYPMIQTGAMRYDDLREVINKTGIQAGEDDRFLAQVFQDAGYATAEIGKLEWGFATTPERIRRHGWNTHFGYYDHRMCHGFYPPFLFEDGEIVQIPGNLRVDCGKNPQGDTPENRALRRERFGKAAYSQDLFDEKAVAFLREQREEPFFLFLPSQLPHGPIDVEEIDPRVKDHPALTEYEQEYATMVLRLDRAVGTVLDELDRLGLADNTIVLFNSDNGHYPYYQCAGRTGDVWHDRNGEPYDNIHRTFTSEDGRDVFDGNDGMAGLKTSNWEGGTRIPFLARWPEQTPPGSVSDHLFAHYDLFATFSALFGQELPPEKDSLSILPALRGRPDEQPVHDAIVYASVRMGGALVTPEGWKLRHVALNDTFQLYNLNDDPREDNDLAAEHPERVRALAARLIAACDGDLANGNILNHRVEFSNKAMVDFQSTPIPPEEAIRRARKGSE